MANKDFDRMTEKEFDDLLNSEALPLGRAIFAIESKLTKGEKDFPVLMACLKFKVDFPLFCELIENL